MITPTAGWRFRAALPLRIAVTYPVTHRAMAVDRTESTPVPQSGTFLPKHSMTPKGKSHTVLEITGGTARTQPIKRVVPTNKGGVAFQNTCSKRTWVCQAPSASLHSSSSPACEARKAALTEACSSLTHPPTPLGPTPPFRQCLSFQSFLTCQSDLPRIRSHS